MDQYTKDFIDAASKIGGVLGVFVAIFVAYVQVRKNREERRVQIEKDRTQREKELQEAINDRQQREEELRWRKAGLAKDVLGELWEDTYASDAMLMLDWENREYNITEDHTDIITPQEVWGALRISGADLNEREKYARECFDNFFSIMQMIEHYISINLLTFEDVEFPFNYFAGKLNQRRDEVEVFLNWFEYQKTLAFLDRCDNWRRTDEAIEPTSP